VGYAPFDNPQVAVAAVVEHGCHGSSAAAPVVRDILTTYMKKYDPDTFAKNEKKEKEEYYSFLKKRNAARQKKLEEEQSESEDSTADGAEE
jgi:penicillin-binding protein 2